MKSANAVRLVARREITERLRSRAMRVITAITALGAVAIIVIPAVARGRTKPSVVGLIGATAQSLATPVTDAAHAAKVNLRVVSVADETTARAEVTSGTLSVALTVTSGATPTADAIVNETLNPTVRALLQTTLDVIQVRRLLAGAGVAQATVSQTLAGVPLSTTALSPAPPDRRARSVAALATALLLYVSLGIYGNAVASGVAQEKTSRTAEVLLATVPPTELLEGKVIGIGLCGLGQLAVALVAAAVANAAAKSAEIPSVVWVLLPSILLWFLLGFGLYALAYAMSGALVARQEEVNFTSMPFTLPLLAGYLLVYAAIAHPDAGWLKVLSFVPPLAPVLMPARIALGRVAAWQVAVSALLMLAAISGMARVAGRIYAAAIFRGGARVPWKTALRLA